MKVIALCAGYATRLYPLTEKTQKAMLTINNKRLIDLLVDECETINEINEIIVITNSKFFQQFKDWQAERKSPIKIKVLNDGTTSNENRLGAIGDIAYVLKQCKIKEDTLITATDNYFTYKLKDYFNFCKEKKAPCVIGKSFEDKDVFYYANNCAIAELNKTNKIIKMAEKPGGNPKGRFAVFCTNFYPVKTLKKFNEYIKENKNLDAPNNFTSWLIDKENVYAYDIQKENVEADCFDIGTKEVYYDLNKKFSK